LEREISAKEKCNNGRNQEESSRETYLTKENKISGGGCAYLEGKTSGFLEGGNKGVGWGGGGGGGGGGGVGGVGGGGGCVWWVGGGVGGGGC